MHPAHVARLRQAVMERQAEITMIRLSEFYAARGQTEKAQAAWHKARGHRQRFKELSKR